VIDASCQNVEFVAFRVNSERINAERIAFEKANSIISPLPIVSATCRVRTKIARSARFAVRLAGFTKRISSCESATTERFARFGCALRHSALFQPLEVFLVALLFGVIAAFSDKVNNERNRGEKHDANFEHVIN
jgi:hypothetical protein